MSAHRGGSGSSDPCSTPQRSGLRPPLAFVAGINALTKRHMEKGFILAHSSRLQAISEGRSKQELERVSWCQEQRVDVCMVSILPLYNPGSQTGADAAHFQGGFSHVNQCMGLRTELGFPGLSSKCLDSLSHLAGLLAS